MQIKLCEEPRWDAGSSKACEFMGFSNCVKHKEPIRENDAGWRECCKSCTTPHHVSDMEK